MQYNKTKRLLIPILVFVIIISSCTIQKSNSLEKDNKPNASIIDKTQQVIFEKLRINDSLLFTLGFNQCDTNQVKSLTSNDFEFYHDQAGITNSKAAFVQSISGLCNLDYKATRVLEINSLEVHLLKENGKVYGAIQHGKHRFYGQDKNAHKPKYLTSTADFTHLWIIEKGDWKLKRVLSYNHKVPD